MSTTIGHPKFVEINMPSIGRVVGFPYLLVQSIMFIVKDLGGRQHEQERVVNVKSRDGNRTELELDS